MLIYFYLHDDSILIVLLTFGLCLALRTWQLHVTPQTKSWEAWIVYFTSNMSLCYLSTVTLETHISPHSIQTILMCHAYWLRAFLILSLGTDPQMRLWQLLLWEQQNDYGKLELLVCENSMKQSTLNNHDHLITIFLCTCYLKDLI